MKCMICRVGDTREGKVADTLKWEESIIIKMILRKFLKILLSII